MLEENLVLLEKYHYFLPYKNGFVLVLVSHNMSDIVRPLFLSSVYGEKILTGGEILQSILKRTGKSRFHT